MRAGLVYVEKLSRETSLVVCNQREDLLGKAMHADRKGIPLVTDEEFLELTEDVSPALADAPEPERPKRARPNVAAGGGSRPTRRRRRRKSTKPQQATEAPKPAENASEGEKKPTGKRRRRRGSRGGRRRRNSQGGGTAES